MPVPISQLENRLTESPTGLSPEATNARGVITGALREMDSCINGLIARADKGNIGHAKAKLREEEFKQTQVLDEPRNPNNLIVEQAIVEDATLHARPPEGFNSWEEWKKKQKFKPTKSSQVVAYHEAPDVQLAAERLRDNPEAVAFLESLQKAREALGEDLGEVSADVRAAHTALKKEQTAAEAAFKKLAGAAYALPHWREYRMAETDMEASIMDDKALLLGDREFKFAREDPAANQIAQKIQAIGQAIATGDTTRAEELPELTAAYSLRLSGVVGTRLAERERLLAERAIPRPARDGTTFTTQVDETTDRALKQVWDVMEKARVGESVAAPAPEPEDQIEMQTKILERIIQRANGNFGPQDLLNAETALTYMLGHLPQNTGRDEDWAPIEALEAAAREILGEERVRAIYEADEKRRAMPKEPSEVPIIFPPTFTSEDADLPDWLKDQPE